MTKQEAIEALQEDGYLADEIRSDWQYLANKVGEQIFYDSSWGIAFTTTYIKRHMKMVTPKRNASRR